MKQDLEIALQIVKTVYARMDHDTPGVDETGDALDALDKAIGEMSIDPEDHALMIREREEEQYAEGRRA